MRVKKIDAQDVAKEQLIADFKDIITTAEELMKVTASQAGEKISAARLKVEDSLKEAKEKLTEAEIVLLDKTKAVAKATDDYVHENPWQSVGLAAAVGLIIGMLMHRH